MRHILIVATAAAAVGLSPAANATFVACLPSVSHPSACPGGEMLFNDAAHKDVTSFVATVGGHSGPDVTVDTTGAVDTGAGFATIKPSGTSQLTQLIFTPADDTLFSDFSFRGQVAPGGTLPAMIDVSWTDSTGVSGTISPPFSVPKADEDFGSFGIISKDGETLKSVTIDLASPGFKEFKQVEFSFAGVSVPEPPIGVFLVGSGLIGLGLVRRRAKAPTV